ncbi:MAG: PQQ-dependent sugar dehydrogenase [Alphaproteobacteria bacterium]
MLGLAFHPDYAGNGRFFVNYTDGSGDTRIVEFRVSANPNIASEAPRPILAIDQPASNHNGGWIGFGPDGYLYIATGDGGGGGDRYGNGQNQDSLLAKILRIDVDNGDPYAIPPGNPWAAAGGGAAETFFWGLRNPWRASFDGTNLFVADVGQNEWEEVTVVSTTDAGVNLGWPIMEGTHCYQATQCDQAGLTLPVHEYSHATGCSITGGYVYRGAAIPELVGHYFFADYCSGFVGSFRYLDGKIRDYRSWTTEIGDIGNVTSFGVDAAGELYITSTDGRVYRVVPR